MTFDITKTCCFPLNNCAGQALWEQCSVTASIIQTSPFMSLETLCCILNMQKSPSSWRVGHVYSVGTEEDGLTCWEHHTEMPELWKRYHSAHKWDNQEAQVICSTAGVQGTCHFRWARPHCMVCMQCAVPVIHQSPCWKLGMKHKAEADNYWKSLTHQPVLLVLKKNLRFRVS